MCVSSPGGPGQLPAAGDLRHREQEQPGDQGVSRDSLPGLLASHAAKLPPTSWWPLLGVTLVSQGWKCVPRVDGERVRHFPALPGQEPSHSCLLKSVLAESWEKEW